MGMLDHWHPMLPSWQLRKKPVGVRLAGKDIALFRNSTGEIGALNDMCPHRRMRLSLGTVAGEKLRCKYHGWTFTCDGQGESPGTPKLQACASTYDVREANGYIWVKSRDSQPVFPSSIPKASSTCAAWNIGPKLLSMSRSITSAKSNIPRSSTRFSDMVSTR